MSHDLAIPLKQLLIASAIAIVLAGCSLPAGRDVRAYDACIARHPQETALCEGPRQAYEVGPSAVEARAVAPRPVTPMPLAPTPTPSIPGSNG